MSIPYPSKGCFGAGENVPAVSGMVLRRACSRHSRRRRPATTHPGTCGNAHIASRRELRAEIGQVFSITRWGNDSQSHMHSQTLAHSTKTCFEQRVFEM